MSLKFMAAALSGLALAACATDGASQADRRAAQADERLAQFERTGEMNNCLSLNRIREIDPLDDRRWLVVERNGAVWLTEASRGCSGASSSFTSLVYATTSNRLCRNEIVRVVDRSSQMTQGSCSIGDFERLEPIETEAE